MKSKLLMIMLFVLLIPILGQANLARISSLGLILTESDWMISDSGNFFSNPAYINDYSGIIDVNGLDLAGSSSYGTALFKTSKTTVLGFTVGFPLLAEADLNLNNTANPQGTGDNLYSRLNTMSGLPNNSVIYGQQIANTVFTSAAGLPTWLDNDITFNKIMLHFGIDMGNMLLGFTARYTGVNQEDSYTVVDSVTPANNASTKSTGSVSEMGLNAGLILKGVILDNLAVNLGVSLPSFSRKDEVTYSVTSGLNLQQDNNELSSDGSLVFDVGATGELKTNKKNSLLFHAAFKSENYSQKMIDTRDVLNDGSFMEAGDYNYTDSYERKYTTIQIGVSDKLVIMPGSFVFVGAYFKNVSHSLAMSGAEADVTQVTANYTDVYKITLTERVLPLIIGAEIQFAKWITTRFSVIKNIIMSRKEDVTEDNYSNDATNTLQDSQNYINSFSIDSAPILNVGLTINLGNFTIDWVLNKTWIGVGSSLLGSAQPLSTQFSLSWKFGGSSVAKTFSKVD